MPLDGPPLDPPDHHVDTVLRVGLGRDPEAVAIASNEDELSWRASSTSEAPRSPPRTEASASSRAIGSHR